MSALTFVCRSLKEKEMKLMLILFLPSVAFAQGVPAPQDGVSFSIFFQFLAEKIVKHLLDSFRLVWAASSRVSKPYPGEMPTAEAPTLERSTHFIFE